MKFTSGYLETLIHMYPNLGLCPKHTYARSHTLTHTHTHTHTAFSCSFLLINSVVDSVLHFLMESKGQVESPKVVIGPSNLNP